jgi:LEA14-like dessication related protein
MADEDDGGGDMSSLRRTVRRLRTMTWLKVLVTVVIIVALVGHVALVVNAANSLEVERVRVISVAPGVVLGDFVATFEITLRNPTGSSIDVDRITYDLYLEDEFIGKGDKADFRVEPGSQTLEFQVTFNAYGLPGPVQELFFSSTTTLTIEGEVTVPIKLFGLWRYTDVTVPYEHEEEVSSGTEPPDNPPPNPVVLAPPVYRPTASVSLTWTMNGDSDFSRYEVHHSTSPDFTPSASTKVTDVTERSTTSHTVGNLQHLTTHYFIIRVYDTVGQHADSNIGSVFVP